MKTFLSILFWIGTSFAASEEVFKITNNDNKQAQSYALNGALSKDGPSNFTCSQGDSTLGFYIKLERLRRDSLTFGLGAQILIQKKINSRIYCVYRREYNKYSSVKGFFRLLVGHPLQVDEIHIFQIDSLSNYKDVIIKEEVSNYGWTADFCRSL